MTEEELMAYIRSRKLRLSLFAPLLAGLSPEAIRMLYAEANTPISTEEAEKIASVRRLRIANAIGMLDEGDMTGEALRGALARAQKQDASPDIPLK